MPNLLTPEERCFIEEEYEVWVQQQSNLALFDGHFFSQKSFEESFIMPVTERLILWKATPMANGITTTTSQSPNTEELFAWMEETAGSIEEAARIAVEKSHVELSAHADTGAPLSVATRNQESRHTGAIFPLSPLVVRRQAFTRWVPSLLSRFCCLKLVTMSAKAKQQFIGQLRGKRGHVRKYTFNDAEQAILDAGRKEWASGRVKAKDLRESLYNDIKDLYLKDNEKRMEGWERDSLRRGVHTFVQLRCKQRSKAARVGTRRLTWRDVLYYQMPQDVAKTKKKLMTKTGKPAFHVHQQAITLVSKKLSSAEVARLKVIASAWNRTGPPDDYKVRNALKKLDKRTQEFARDVLTQHGAIYFFMYAFKGADGGIQTGTQEWTNLFRGRSFDVERRKQWDGSGAFAIWDLWAKDVLLGEDRAAARAGPADLVNGKDPALFQLERNADDQPLLPNLDLKKFDKAAVHMKYSTWVAAVFRAFVSYWYGVGRGVVGRRVKVPWKFLKEHTITDWIAEEFVPEGSERLGDPDKDMNGLEGLLPLLEHWYERQESGEAEVLRFHHVAEPISGQNKKYRRVPSADEPDDFTLPPRPDAANTDSGDEDLAGKDSEEKGGEAPQSVAVHGVGSEDSEDEIVAQTQRKHRKSEKRTGKDMSDDSDTHSATLAKRSSQKSGAHQGRGGASDSEGVVHGRPRRTKSGLLARPTDSDHSDVEVGDQPKRRGQQRKGRGMIVRSDDDVGTPAGAPDVPDAQYRFVEGGSKYEVEETFDQDLAGILGARGATPVHLSPFDDEGGSPGHEVETGGPFSGRGPLLSFASQDLGVEEESDTPLAQKGPKASGTQESDSDNSDENDVTKILDHVEDSEEPAHAPPRQLREETPTPAGGQSSGSGKGGTTNGKGQTKPKSGGAKDGGQGKARDEDEDEDSLARGKKKVRESGRDTEPDTRRTRAQSGKQTAGTRTAPPPETPTRLTRARAAATPTMAPTPESTRRSSRRLPAQRTLSPVPESPTHATGKRKPRARMVTTSNKPPPDGRDEWDLSGRRKGRRI
ncbi:hypothetical protein FA13DRAFT_1798561 [Coprinellus micaceus]|uniref:Uncharacterized protein n=1 Tax=Coprinellus micaceus TaxID=71717 RepID=A0A4Y7SLV1_COPMI|nr:hypothetical protein FA13DRAFT_1798561 [Coprinellus micaceus]